MRKHIILTVVLAGVSVLFVLVFGLVMWKISTTSQEQGNENYTVQESTETINDDDLGVQIEENLSEKEPQVVEEVDTSGWQTYRNEEYGYAISYPPKYGIIKLPQIGEEGGSLRLSDWSVKNKDACYVSIHAIREGKVGYGINLSPVIQRKIIIDSMQGDEIILEDYETKQRYVQIYLYNDLTNYIYSINYPLKSEDECSVVPKKIIQTFSLEN